MSAGGKIWEYHVMEDSLVAYLLQNNVPVVESLCFLVLVSQMALLAPSPQSGQVALALILDAL